MQDLQNMTPEQRAELLRRLQQAGVTLPGSQQEQPPVLELQIPQQAITPPVTPPQEQPFEETPYDFGTGPGGPDELEDLELFGRDIFRLEAEAWEPVMFGPVSPDYLIGPGDQIIIDLWGDVEEIYDRTVNREGYINIPRVGQVILTNLTVEQAKTRLLRQMTRSYQSLNNGQPGATAFLDVTLGKLRVIKVYVMGAVTRPGAYNLSSVSTAFTAIYTAGGPSNAGSMRKVQVVRGTELVTEIDIYDYLLRADKSADERLWNGDIVFVPDIGPKVAVRGRIQRPAVYELKGDEGLAGLIDMAGGLTVAAYRDMTQIVRIVPPELRSEYEEDRITLDVPLSRVIDDPEVDVPLYDGDVITIFSILSLRRDFVVVDGAVWRPTQYQFVEGMRLTDLLESADGLKEEAYLERAEIIRTNPDYTTTQLRVNLSRALAGNEEDNILLQKLDRVVVRSIHDIEDRKYVEIRGHVRTPGRYLLHEDMRLSDLLFRAGGLYDPDWRKETYLDRGDLIRVSPDSISRVIDTFNLGRVLEGDSSEDRLLQNNDIVRVYSIYTVEHREYATIVGEVKDPGEYEIEENTTVNDLIIRAGGLTREAWATEAQISRVRPGESGERKETYLLSAPIDTTYTGREHGFRLQDFDLVIIRRIPYWELQRNVKVSGEVAFPGVHTLRTPDETLSSIIERAGGLTPYAYPDGARLIRTYGRAGLVAIDLEEALQRPNSRSNLVMMPGDSLHVPQRVYTVAVSGAVGFPSSILHVPGKGPRYYIEEAGGLNKSADRNQIRVVEPNGAIWRLRRSLLHNSTVKPGSLIHIPEKEERETNTWEIIRDTTAILSSLTTVLLVLWRLGG